MDNSQIVGRDGLRPRDVGSLALRNRQLLHVHNAFECQKASKSAWGAQGDSRRTWVRVGVLIAKPAEVPWIAAAKMKVAERSVENILRRARWVREEEEGTLYNGKTRRRRGDEGMKRKPNFACLMEENHSACSARGSNSHQNALQNPRSALIRPCRPNEITIQIFRYQNIHFSQFTFAFERRQHRPLALARRSARS